MKLDMRAQDPSNPWHTPTAPRSPQASTVPVHEELLELRDERKLPA